MPTFWRVYHVILHCTFLSFINFRKFIFILFFIFYWGVINICCFCLVAKLCLTLCSPMNCSPPGFPVLHYLQSLLRIMSIDSEMLFSRLILCSLVVKNPHAMQEMQVWSWIGKIPWRRKWQSTPVFLPRKCHGPRSVVDTTTVTDI